MVKVSLNALDAATSAIADSKPLPHPDALGDLAALGLVSVGSNDIELTELGERYFHARFVAENDEDAHRILGEAAAQHPIVTAFLAAVWGGGPVPVTGALRLLRRLTGSLEDVENRRWLELMNRGGLIRYNRASPTLQVLMNPAQLSAPEAAAILERKRGHAVSPERPYGNLLALVDLVRSARDWIRWYEQHLPAKVLEVLYREVDGAHITQIRLLSGPANVDDRLTSEFKRFRTEMESERAISVAWRILSKDDARKRHDRYFISRDLSRNLPPLNSILANSAGEILPSEFTVGEFDEWWELGTDL